MNHFRVPFPIPNLPPAKVPVDPSLPSFDTYSFRSQRERRLVILYHVCEIIGQGIVFRGNFSLLMGNDSCRKIFELTIAANRNSISFKAHFQSLQFSERAEILLFVGENVARKLNR